MIIPNDSESVKTLYSQKLSNFPKATLIISDKANSVALRIFPETGVYQNLIMSDGLC